MAHIEQRTITLAPEDRGVLLDDNVSIAIEREADRHPIPKSRRGQLIYFQNTFGWDAHPIEAASMLGVSEEDARRFLSRRGIRNSEFEAIQERFYDLVTIARMAERVHPGKYSLVDRRAMLATPNPLFDDFPNQGRCALDLMVEGQTHRVVSVLQNAFEFQNREHPESM